jgi:hypothetical protein
MPKITQINQIDISPEKFLNACSPEELIEVELLLYSPRFQDKIPPHNSKIIEQP